MKSNLKGLLKGASLLALGVVTLAPAANAQTWRDYQREQRQDRREDRRDRREERREERREARRGRDWGDYNGWGGSQQLRQTALNAGYNAGIKEGRRNRNRGYRNPNDFSAYRNATKDYNSRYGDRALYQRFYRQGFENGYRDGLNGY